MNLLGNAVFIDEQISNKTNLVTLYQHQLALFSWRAGYCCASSHTYLAPIQIDKRNSLTLRDPFTKGM